MDEPMYWIRMGTRSQGPFALSELQRRAKTGALSRIAMVKGPDGNWAVASSMPGLFSGSVEPPPPPAMPEFIEEAPSAPQYAVRLPGGGTIAAPWVLVPAWIVVAVAALMPTQRLNELAFWAWNFSELADAFGWRGVTLGLIWIVVMAIALGAIQVAALAAGRTRAAIGITLCSVCCALSIAAYAFGATGAAGSCGAVLTAIASLRLIDATVNSPSPSKDGAGIPLTSPAESFMMLIGAILVALVAIVAAVIKGLPFAVSAGLVVCSATLVAISAIHASGEHPNKNVVRWCAIPGAFTATLAILAEGVTRTILGEPRMATFDSIRTICLTTLLAICAYLSLQELRLTSTPQRTS